MAVWVLYFLCTFGFDDDYDYDGDDGDDDDAFFSFKDTQKRSRCTKLSAMVEKSQSTQRCMTDRCLSIRGAVFPSLVSCNASR